MSFILPRISVVTCSYNQGQFIGRTIDSVLAQNYPNFEHIVVDARSTDETSAVLQRYPHLRVVCEPDGGQAEAINKGFRLASGDVFCFLNSDDLFYPGALYRVAREIDPKRGRHVVMGRCAYIDEDDRPTGIEHASVPCSHERLLRSWHGNPVPQPATFWTREVWERCGPLDESEHLVLDYDLMCRIRKHYPFHWVDQVLAGYRRHTRSKSCARHQEFETAALRVSQRYWGPPWLPRYWRLACSLALNRLERRGRRRQRAGGWMRLAAELRKQGVRGRALGCLARAAWLAPEVALHHFCRRLVVLGCQWGMPSRYRPRSFALTWQSPGLPEVATVWRSFSDRHPDGLIGPHHATTVEVGPSSCWVRMEGRTIGALYDQVLLPLEVTLAIDGRPAQRHRLTTGGPFDLEVSLAGLSSGPHRLEIICSSFVVSDDLFWNTDCRPLTLRLDAVRVVGDVAGRAVTGLVGCPCATVPTPTWRARMTFLARFAPHPAAPDAPSLAARASRALRYPRAVLWPALRRRAHMRLPVGVVRALRALLHPRAVLWPALHRCARSPIQELSTRARRLRETVAARVRSAMTPTLGILSQYPPRPLALARSVRPPRSAPLISIVTPSFNQAVFLERTMRSVLDQGYPALEYIVQDGGSTDDTLALLERYRDRLTHCESRRDHGQAHAINLGFRHARGEVLAYLNSDDLLLPGTLAYVARYFHRHPDVDVIYSHRVIIDSDDREIGRWVLPPHDDEILSWADFVPQETLFWRRRIWERVGSAIDEDFQFALDWDLLLRFRDAGARITRVSRFLGAFRVHPQQKTSSRMADLGYPEMVRLRQRSLGRTVTDAEVYQAILPYLRKHSWYQLLSRAGVPC
jgi:glycosyltransferase involved in cell wall biosynthesis